jgi:DNA-directed RNA polymerase specialized sigma24 family protein
MNWPDHIDAIANGKKKGIDEEKQKNQVIARLFQKNQWPFEKYLHDMGANSDDAKDLIQDAFLKMCLAVKNMDDNGQKEKITPQYVKRVLKNAFIDLKRREKRWKWILSTDYNPGEKVSQDIAYNLDAADILQELIHFCQMHMDTNIDQPVTTKLTHGQKHIKENTKKDRWQDSGRKNPQEVSDFYQYYINNQSYEDIAAKSHKTVGAVKSNVSKFKGKAEQYLRRKFWKDFLGI